MALRFKDFRKEFSFEDSYASSIDIKKTVAARFNVEHQVDQYHRKNQHTVM